MPWWGILLIVLGIAAFIDIIEWMVKSGRASEPQSGAPPAETALVQ